MKLAGIVCLRLKQYDKALEYFRRLETIPLEVNPGKFYHALALVERGTPEDLRNAKIILKQVIEKDLDGKETAAEWLKKL